MIKSERREQFKAKHDIVCIGWKFSNLVFPFLSAEKNKVKNESFFQINKVTVLQCAYCLWIP